MFDEMRSSRKYEVASERELERIVMGQTELLNHMREEQGKKDASTSNEEQGEKEKVEESVKETKLAQVVRRTLNDRGMPLSFGAVAPVIKDGKTVAKLDKNEVDK